MTPQERLKNLEALLEFNKMTGLTLLTETIEQEIERLKEEDNEEAD